jgi:hypothetical protein
MERGRQQSQREMLHKCPIFLQKPKDVVVVAVVVVVAAAAVVVPRETIKPNKLNLNQRCALLAFKKHYQLHR